MAGLCEGGNEPPGSLKAILKRVTSSVTSGDDPMTMTEALAYGPTACESQRDSTGGNFGIATQSALDQM
ncbi:hypothetical protein ANN_13233 [Periplaneta americana]|uniref:Uncharacterized protein n=1 Tax=Periplaneta americana TaxID=6978 RepID=A0ABQ8TLD8_PERAM|nr:hypothetical protein ANN_13233 [Periplaneta americana]